MLQQQEQQQQQQQPMSTSPPSPSPSTTGNGKTPSPSPTTTPTTAAAPTTMEQLHQEEEECECCPLCLNDMDMADRIYVIKCPTVRPVACTFNYCSDCMDRLLGVSQEDYQLASDGSKQLKVPLQCPQCRMKYQMKNKNENNNNSNSNNNTSWMIVSALLILRQAYRIQQWIVLKQSDAMLNASQLTKKRTFLLECTLIDLQMAYERIIMYYDGIGYSTSSTTKNNASSSSCPPALDWQLWHQYLSSSSVAAASSSSTSTSSTTSSTASSTTTVASASQEGLVGVSTSSSSSSPSSMLTSSSSSSSWRDPTLFLGLEDCISKEEQIYLTNLFISGQSDKIIQACQIVHGIMNITISRQALQTVHSLSNFTSSSSSMNHHHPNHSTNSTTNSSASNSIRMNRNHSTITTNTTTATMNKSSLSISKGQSNNTTKTTISNNNIPPYIRQKYPLPIHMPRYIQMKRNELIQLLQKGISTLIQHQYQLMICKLIGSMGMIGLRKGDQITHIFIDDHHHHGHSSSCMDPTMNLVSTLPSSSTTTPITSIRNHVLTQLLSSSSGLNPHDLNSKESSYSSSSSSSSTVMIDIVVNVHEETVVQLYKRAKQIQQDDTLSSLYH